MDTISNAQTVIKLLWTGGWDSTTGWWSCPGWT